jgi:hypothetical protein
MTRTDAAEWRCLGDEDAAPLTRFEAYLRHREIKPAHLAQRSGYTRQHILRLRFSAAPAGAGGILGVVLNRWARARFARASHRLLAVAPPARKPVGSAGPTP